MLDHITDEKGPHICDPADAPDLSDRAAEAREQAAAIRYEESLSDLDFLHALGDACAEHLWPLPSPACGDDWHGRMARARHERQAKALRTLRDAMAKADDATVGRVVREAVAEFMRGCARERVS